MTTDAKALPRHHLIHRPQDVAVAAVDDHLPAIAPERLTAAAVRERLVQAHASEQLLRGDSNALGGRDERCALTPAAVLVPLVIRADGLHVLLTRRTDHLHEHAGQISFPGGRAERSDRDANATALREAREEVGLEPRWVEVIGHLPVYATITRYAVTPVVALVGQPHRLALDAFEVAEAFEVPLPFLMNPAHHRRHVVEFNGVKREFLSMPWNAGGARPEPYFIWGATAAILRNLYHVLAG